MAIAESHSGCNTHRSSRHDSGMDETHDQSGFDHLRKYVSASTISSPASHNYIYCKIATRCNCCTTARGRNQLIYRCRRRKQTGDCNFSACLPLCAAQTLLTFCLIPALMWTNKHCTRWQQRKVFISAQPKQNRTHVAIVNNLNMLYLEP